MTAFHCIRRLAGTVAILALALCGCDSDHPDDPVRNTEPEPDKELRLSIELTGPAPTGITARIVPDDLQATYWCGPVTRNAYEAAGDVGSHVAALIAAARSDNPSLTLEQVVASLQRTGISELQYTDLEPQTDYYFCATGLEDDGTCIPQATAVAFTTPALPGPEKGFQVTVSDIRATGATVSVEPEDERMPYYFDVVTAADYQACNGDLSQIVSGLLQFILENNPGRTVEEITAVIRSVGADEDTLERLPSSTDFYAFAIGLDDDGTCTTRATVTPFRTLDPGDPAKCTFTIGISNLHSESAVVEVTPSDETTGYFTAIIPEQEYGGDANLVARIRQAFEQIAAERQISVSEAVEMSCWRGPSQELQDGLTPSTSYYAFAYALNADASAAGPLFKERFTTKGLNSSNASCTLAIDKYFDGDELEAYDPERYAGMSGRVYVLLTAEPNADAAHWYTALGRGDMTDASLYPEETTIDALLQGGTADKTRMQYIAQYGEVTLLSVAADHSYQFGPVFRSLQTLSPQGTSPVSEIDDARAESPAACIAPASRQASEPAANRSMQTLLRRTERHASPLFRAGDQLR